MIRTTMGFEAKNELSYYIIIIILWIIIRIYGLSIIRAWWLNPTPLKNNEFPFWDHQIPFGKNNNACSSHQQPAISPKLVSFSVRTLWKYLSLSLVPIIPIKNKNIVCINFRPATPRVHPGPWCLLSHEVI